MADLHPSIAALSRLGPIKGDDVDFLDQAHALIETLPDAPTVEEIKILVRLLPADGDLGFGLNWAILHCIEASPHWPIWELLETQDHEWIERLRTGLRNAGETPPA